MDQSGFADLLREAIIGCWDEFRQQHGEETPYAFAIIGGLHANYLGYAVATEEGLRHIAADYDALGYRYQAPEWDEFDNCEELAAWLRWANPDDGWHYGDFSARFHIQPKLHQLVETGGLGKDGDDFEEFCTEVLLSLQNVPLWREQVVNQGIVVGFTYGEDPRDFLRTATRANPYPVVRRLWAETWHADSLSSRIEAPHRKP